MWASAHTNFKEKQMSTDIKAKHFKLIGASFLVLWWLISGFFKKILDVLKLVARIKKIFVSQKENSKGGDR